MIYIELKGRLKISSSRDYRAFITSDETWAFTEQPENDNPEKDTKCIPPHELFSLFTAEIIKANTLFVR